MRDRRAQNAREIVQAIYKTMGEFSSGQPVDDAAAVVLRV